MTTSQINKTSATNLPRYTAWIAIGVLMLFTTVPYLNTFGAPFVFDDSHNIVDNFYIRINSLSLLNLWQAASSSPSSHRWLPNISFALNYYAGGLEVWGYHLVNLAVHLITAAALYLLFVTTLSRDGRQRQVAETAFFATLLWALHPVQTNSVTYVVQRMTSMAALFSILALLCYARARIASPQPKKILFLILSGATGLMALASKENAAMLPITVAAYEFFFFSRPGSLKYIGSKRHLTLAGLAVAAAVILCGFYLGFRPLDAILGTYSNREFTLAERLLTEARVIIHYLSLLAMPLPGRLNLAHDFPLSFSLINPPATLAAILTLVALLTAMVRTAKHQRLLAFAIFWFLANLVIESSFIGLELIFEHRLYLPSTFIILAFSAWAAALFRSRPATGRLLLTGIAIGLMVITWQRNAAWQSAVSLWTDAAAKSPGLARVHGNLGNALAQEKRLPEAEKQLLQALELQPNDGRTYINLGTLYEEMKRYPEAIAMLNRVFQSPRGDRATAHRSLATIYLATKDYPQAATHGSMAVSANPRHPKGYFLLGKAYLKLGQLDQAEQTMKTALAYLPENGDLLLSLATVFEKQNRLGEALAAATMALEKKEVNAANGYNLLGILYWRQQDYRQSIAAAEQAIALDQDLLDAYITLGVTLEDSGARQQAFSQYRKAWEKGYDMVGMYLYWAKNHLRNGNQPLALAYLQEALRLEPNNDAARQALIEAANTGKR